jgi:hypothetical protein
VGKNEDFCANPRTNSKNLFLEQETGAVTVGRSRKQVVERERK